MTPHTTQETPTDSTSTYASISDVCQVLNIPTNIVQWLVSDFKALETLHDMRYVDPTHVSQWESTYSALHSGNMMRQREWSPLMSCRFT